MPTQVFFHSPTVDIRYVGTKFTTIAKRGDIAVKNAVRLTAEWTLTRAKIYVPYKKGFLQASGSVQTAANHSEPGLRTSHSGRNVSVVTFGNNEVQYAILQHQERFNHPNGRIRLYLKVALDDTNREQILNRAITNGLKGIASEVYTMRTMLVPQ